MVDKNMEMRTIYIDEESINVEGKGEGRLKVHNLNNNKEIERDIVCVKDKGNILDCKLIDGTTESIVIDDTLAQWIREADPDNIYNSTFNFGDKWGEGFGIPDRIITVLPSSNVEVKYF